MGCPPASLGVASGRARASTEGAVPWPALAIATRAEPVGFNLFDFAFRPEVIGTALVVSGLAAVPVPAPDR